MNTVITHEQRLALEQATTLETPRRPYGMLARMLFLVMDLVYGKQRTLPKFKVLEVVARVPYQAWESVAYVALTHEHRTPKFARRIFEFVEESRAQQDNEQWHLLILEELVEQQQVPQGCIKFGLLPQLLALIYYHVSWLLYVVRPELSYLLNADFEDHAEHEYMTFVAEHPEFEEQRWNSSFESDYGAHGSLANLLRQIGLDERHHKQESLAHLPHARFSLEASEFAHIGKL